MFLEVNLLPNVFREKITLETKNCVASRFCRCLEVTQNILHLPGERTRNGFKLLWKAPAKYLNAQASNCYLLNMVKTQTHLVRLP